LQSTEKGQKYQLQFQEGLGYYPKGFTERSVSWC